MLMANTVPPPQGPPTEVVPYKVLPTRTNVHNGWLPSVLVGLFKGVGTISKSCKTRKPVPSVFSLKTVPLPKLPPAEVVPYSVPSDEVRDALGIAPSLLVGEPVTDWPDVAAKLWIVLKEPSGA